MEVKNDFYTREFRESFLKLLIESQQHYYLFSKYINPRIFPESDLKVIYESIRNIRESSEQLGFIPKSLIDAEINNICIKRGIEKNLVLETAEKLYKRIIDEYKEEIAKKAKEWLVRERMIVAIKRIVEKIEKGENLKDAEELVKTALEIDFVDLNYAELDDLFELKTKIENDRDKEKLISTGFIGLDTYLMGGLAPKEITTILGVPKSGKTTFCIQLGVNFLKQGKTVLHIHLEPSQSENVILWKYGACITGMSYWDIYDNYDLYVKRMRVFKEIYHKGKLFVKKFPAKSTDVTFIKGMIQTLMLEDKIKEPPNVIIIDYDDLLKPLRRADSLYEQSGRIYEDVISIAEQFGCHIVMPSQINREGKKKMEKNEIVTSADMAHSFMKTMHVNNILALNVLDKRTLLVYVDSVRFGESRVEVMFDMDLRKNRYVEKQGDRLVKKFPDVDDFADEIQTSIEEMKKYIESNKPFEVIRKDEVEIKEEGIVEDDAIEF